MTFALIARPQDRKVVRVIGNTHLTVGGVLQPETEALAVLLEPYDFPPWHDLELPLTGIGFVQALMVHGLVQTVQKFGANDTIVGRFVGEGGSLAGFGSEAVEIVDAFRVEDFVDARVV